MAGFIDQSPLLLPMLHRGKTGQSFHTPDTGRDRRFARDDERAGFTRAA